jgi:methionine-rich copper-binding protein CopC
MNPWAVVARSAAFLTVFLTVAASAVAAGVSSTPVSALPRDHAHLMTAPKTVTLTFAAPIDPRSVTFRVYRFPLPTMMVGDKPMSGTQMDVFAGQEALKMLALKTDTADRMDTGQVSSAPGSKVVIGLKPDLAPGIYITAWRPNGPGGKIGFVHFHFGK